jgi:hypothetical protein
VKFGVLDGNFSLKNNFSNFSLKNIANLVVHVYLYFLDGIICGPFDIKFGQKDPLGSTVRYDALVISLEHDTF